MVICNIKVLFRPRCLNNTQGGFYCDTIMNMFLLLSIIFSFTFIIGKIIERIRVPWVFAALVLGAMLAIYDPFSELIASKTFVFLAQLGLYFLLFLVGLEIDIPAMKSKGKFIVKATFIIILTEAFLGSLLVHFVFGCRWVISILVATSFATVGEAILVPILDEFKMINTPLGSTILGVGTLDDVFEILTLLIVSLMVSSGYYAALSLLITLATLGVLVSLTLELFRLKQRAKRLAFLDVDLLFLFVLAVLFLFLGIGEYASSAPLAAILAGIGLRAMIPEAKRETIIGDIKTICYSVFSPIFFVWVGASMDVHFILTSPLLVVLVVVVTKASKLLGSYIVAKDEFSLHDVILLGIGLSIRFSTSIVVVKLLLDYGLIDSQLYSVIIASSMAFKFIVPFLFSTLVVRWHGKKRHASTA